MKTFTASHLEFSEVALFPWSFWALTGTFETIVLELTYWSLKTNKQTPKTLKRPNNGIFLTNLAMSLLKILYNDDNIYMQSVLTLWIPQQCFIWGMFRLRTHCCTWLLTEQPFQAHRAEEKEWKCTRVHFNLDLGLEAFHSPHLNLLLTTFALKSREVPAGVQTEGFSL